MLETDSLDPPLDLPLENLGDGAQISASLISTIGGGVIHLRPDGKKEPTMGRGNSVFQTESGETSSSALDMLSWHCPLDIQREIDVQ